MTTLPLAQGLDPQIETATGLRIFPRIYGYTHHVDPRDDALILDHAANIEQPDDTTIIIGLRDGVLFQDIAPVSGRAVDSADVVDSIERYRDNPLVANKTWHATILDRLEAPDARTVVIRTRRPYAYSLHELGGINAGAILPKELVATHADLSATAIGSGPFRLDRVSNASGARIIRHERYMALRLPYLDAMEWTVIDGDDAKIAAFESQQADVIANRDLSEARRLVTLDSAITSSAVPALSYLSLGLRVDRAPFNDPRIREAVDVALDRNQMITDVVRGDGNTLGPVNGHLAGGYWSLAASETGAAQRAGDVAEARRESAHAAIEQAGAGSAIVRLQVPNSPQLIDVATVVREHLGRAGLNIQLDVLDELRWFLNFRGGQFDATLISQPPYEWPDAPTRLYHSGGLDGTHNQFGFADPEIDSLLARSWGESDREQRRRTLLDAQRLMIAARPMLQLFTTTSYASAWNYVRNWRHDLPGSLAQYNYEQSIERG